MLAPAKADEREVGAREAGAEVAIKRVPELVPQDVAEAIRYLLLPQASCITPNGFELAWLSGLAAGGEEAAVALPALALELLAALALLALLAWASARTALFVITSRRVVMKIGVALQVFYNLPFSQIRNAALRVESDGTGEVTLQLSEGKRIGYLHLWPFARPRVKQRADRDERRATWHGF